MGIGRVMSLFSSSVVGVKLSWLFTVIYCQIVRGGGYGSVFTVLKGISVFWVFTC